MKRPRRAGAGVDVGLLDAQISRAGAEDVVRSLVAPPPPAAAKVADQTLVLDELLPQIGEGSQIAVSPARTSVAEPAVSVQGTDLLEELSKLGIPTEAIGGPATPMEPPPPVVESEAAAATSEAASPTNVSPGASDSVVEGVATFQVFELEPARFNLRDLNQLLVWGAQNGVSDTFVCSGAPVLAQKSGRLIRLTRRRLELDEVSDLLHAIKPNADAQIIQGTDVNARHDFSPARGVRYAFRVCAIGCQGVSVGARSIEITLRTIPFDIPTVAALDIEQRLIRAAYPRDGLVLVTGATGSGKSTLLASLLQHRLQTADSRILTYEHPIEFSLVTVPNMQGMVRQCEIGRDIDSFSNGIRNALRCKPDVILIGEARDRETIEMTIRAAETGHTVYTTVHTRNVVNAIDRMCDEFPTDAQWAIKVKLVDAMRLIVNQVLVRAPGGGRTALKEYLEFTEPIREELIMGGAAAFNKNITRIMSHQGHKLLKDAEEKFKQGRILEKDLNIIRAERGH